MRGLAGHRGRGFTLIEAVIVLFLTGTILLAVAKLVSQSIETLKFLQEKGRTMESASLGCERVASELREAARVGSFGAGFLQFDKVRPSAPEAAGNDFEDESVAAEDWVRDYGPGGLNQLYSVGYQLDSQHRLRRTAGGRTDTVATGVNSFVVSSAPGTGCYTLALSIKEKRRIIAFRTSVTCSALQEGYTP